MVMSIRYDIMLDLEFLACTPDASVIQIAARAFGPEAPVDTWFNGHINEINGEVDMDTMIFWMRQSIEGSKMPYEIEAAGQGTYDILHGFADWLRPQGFNRIWAKGTLDFAIMSNQYKNVQYSMPWNFRQEHELRTLLRVAEVDNENGGHDALEDCNIQVRCLIEALEKLNDAAL